jgi:hypothetical protein
MPKHSRARAAIRKLFFDTSRNAKVRIQKLRQEKRALEKAIGSLIDDFEDRNGINISGVRLTRSIGESPDEKALTSELVVETDLCF